MESILFLANKFSLSELLISFEEINISFDKIKNFFHLITANPEEIKITFRSIEESSKNRLDSNLEDLYLISVFIKLGNFYISQILGLFGKVDEGTDPNMFKVKKIEMLTNRCIHEKDYTPDLKEKIQIKIDSLTEKYSKSHNIFVAGD